MLFILQSGFRMPLHRDYILEDRLSVELISAVAAVERLYRLEFG